MDLDLKVSTNGQYSGLQNISQEGIPIFKPMIQRKRHNSYNYFAVLILLLLSGSLQLTGCKGEPSREQHSLQDLPADSIPADTTEVRVKAPALPPLETLPDSLFIRLADYSDAFSYDLRYATANNFLKEAVYECAECYTRASTARALIAANTVFQSKGYRIRFFDCYRPNSVQYAMWEIFPNPQYVANPVKGSIHNKGGAVDITLETLDGEVLEMGTDFDFFVPRAHHDHTALPAQILENRRLLKSVMEAHGFWSIRTEWWHYNLKAASVYSVADFKWECP
ncbi:M15 family metallopeptidase [Robiginitalea sp. IMCC44478]|uniref:M15 family metallopeptidase n=1 Tax=Robiginitalea sp. IMCC44478 TaxID=3459122 RepID=UPI004041B51E